MEYAQDCHGRRAALDELKESAKKERIALEGYIVKLGGE
jgi:hypothetical protein